MNDTNSIMENSLRFSFARMNFCGIIKSFPILAGAFLFFYLQAIFVWAQTPTSNWNDSLHLALQRSYKSNIELNRQQQQADSVKKAELERQLSQLGAAESLRRESLQTQLDAIAGQVQKRTEEWKANIDSLKNTLEAFPVLGYEQDTLFFMYYRSGSFTPSERAIRITERINQLKDTYSFSDSTLKIVESESTVDVVSGEVIVVSVSEADAMLNDASQMELATKYRQLITDDVKRYKAETNVTTLLKKAGFALLVLAVLIMLIVAVNRLFKWITLKINSQKGKKLVGIKFNNYTLLNEASQVKFLMKINSAFRWIFIILLVYIALPIIFGFFPWTQNFAQTLFGYILDPVKKIGWGMWNYLPNLFTISVIFVFFKYILKAFYFLKIEIETKKMHVPGFYPDWASPTYQILKIVLYAFMFVLIFPYLPGSNSPIFRGVSVFLGFLFTFGSAGSISNIIAGIVLTYMRLFKIGDRVKIGDVTGDVIEKSMLVTRVRSIKNEIISIPNATVMSGSTVNYSSEVEQGSALIMYTTVTIGYDVPWKAMHQALLLAADRTRHFLKEPKPFVLQTSLDDFYVSYQINAYTQEPSKQATIYSELHQHIQDCCNEAGIEILSPHYRSARDGNMTSIPANYLNKDYEAPAWRIEIKNKE